MRQNFGGIAWRKSSSKYIVIRNYHSSEVLLVGIWQFSEDQLQSAKDEADHPLRLYSWSL
jgi:hypothetical protein